MEAVMKIQNYLEEVVADELEILIAERGNICKCQKCKFDMMVWALNRLPAQYVITDRGRLYTKLSEQEAQFKADVVKELTKAITRVSKNPHC
jgi:competence protein ComFB